jgi:BlaI family penicillinase repressor
MHEKGFLSRKKSGRMHIYEPILSENDTQKQLVNRLLNNMFQGSAFKLIMQALGNTQTSKEEIDQIREYLDELESNTSNQKGDKA